mgnify:CR=1 FL=1
MLFVNFSKKSSIWIVIWQKRQYYNPNYIKIQVTICEKSVFSNLDFCGIMVIITKIVSLCSFFNQNEFIEEAVSYKEKGNYMKDLYRDYRRKYLTYILYVLIIVTIAQLFFIEPLKAGSYLTNATAKKYLMKNILCANIYKEYEFYDESNNINGIIDLMLVYDDRVDIIDYKTKNIDDEGYEKQLATYKKYIKNVLKMPVNCYLYSLITGQIKEV